MAHELTHVVQQRAHTSTVAAKSIAIAPTTDAAEREADTVAQQVISGADVSHFIRQHPIAIQKADPESQKPAAKEQVTLSSGLKVDKDLFFNMLAMCNQGKLDPLKCFEMRKALQDALGETGVGRYPGLNLGLDSKKDGKLLSPLDVKNLMQPDPRLGLGAPILPPPGWMPPAASPAPASGSQSSSGLPDISFIKNLMEPEFDLHIGKLKVTIPKGLEMKFASLPLKGTNRLQISAKGELTNLKGLVEQDPKKHEPPVGFSLSVSLEGNPIMQISATLTVSLESNTIKTGLSFMLFDGSCHFKVPNSAIDKINSAAQGLKKYSDSASLDETQLPKKITAPPSAKDAANSAESTSEKQASPPSNPLDVVTDVAPHIISLFEAIQEIENAKKKCQRGPSIKIGPYMTLPFGPDKPGTADSDPTRKPNFGLGVEVRF